MKLYQTEIGWVSSFLSKWSNNLLPTKGFGRQTQHQGVNMSHSREPGNNKKGR